MFFLLQQFSGINYIHDVGQSAPLFIFKAFSSPQGEIVTIKQ